MAPETIHFLVKRLFCRPSAVDVSKGVIVFASPRGGSTWIAETIFASGDYLMASEPLNVRRELLRAELGLDNHYQLHGDEGWESIHPYYRRLLSAEIPEFLPLPFRRFYRYNIRRVVVKQNQGGGDLLGRIEDTFGCRIVHCLRHPIAVAISREVFPLLPGFSRSPLRRRFSDEQLRVADHMIVHGSHIEKGVLAWCLHHLPAIQDTRDSWHICFYEEGVVGPKKYLESLCEFLNVEPNEGMLSRLERPSAVTRKSDRRTQAILNDPARRNELISKWRDRVEASELESVQGLLNVFGVECYRVDRDLPVR